MDRFDKIYRLHGLLSNRRTPVSLENIKEQLECSKATVTRTIETLRDYLNAPLEYNREANGYFYNQQSANKPYELPGLWFSSEELHGLLICQQILQNISPGILSEQINSLQQRINTMLSKENSPQPVIADKIQFTTVGRRLKDDSHFKRIATALFSNKQIHIQYQARGYDGEQSERIISAQKLIFYRDNWYLAAHCHNKNDLRIFSVDRVHSAHILDKTAQQIPNNQLQEFIQSSYGIFTGKAQYTAVLEFTKNRANWVADEQWHAEQQSQWLENGNYQLSIPFSDSRELIMDILKHGAEVKVIEPPFLLSLVEEEIKKMQKNYCNLAK
jgi:predicted DNA-binding transcriptional regulator YafY